MRPEARELGGDVVARGEQRGRGEGERAGGAGGGAEEVATVGHRGGRLGMRRRAAGTSASTRAR